eukprot:gene12049-12191_t
MSTNLVEIAAALAAPAPIGEAGISGAIMFKETLYQSSADGTPFVDCLRRQGVMPGIKVDEGLEPFAGHELSSGETSTRGLEKLADSCAEYVNAGAKFAKWRGVIRINQAKGFPSEKAVELNAQQLAQYAAVCQAAGLVPIVEPEVLIDGSHSAATFGEVTERVIGATINQLWRQCVLLEGCLLKPQMIIPGADAGAGPAQPDDVAHMTLRSMRRVVPAALPGIMFLSGGQTEEEATVNLNTINQLAQQQGRAPWSLSFSYGRALQASVLKIWSADKHRKAEAQQMAVALAAANAAASLGKRKLVFTEALVCWVSMDLQHLHSTEDDALVITGDVYKQTIVADYVVKRYVRLYRDRFITSRHDNPDEQRVFLFDHAARLVPADRALIERRKRHIRPPGVGSMTALAAIRGKGQPVQLWSFKLDASEYSFKFCFEDQATAYKWHELLTQIIDHLRAAAGLAPISPAKHPSATSWAPADSITLPATNSAANSDLGRAADAAANGVRGSQLHLKGTDSCHSAAFGFAGDAADSDDAELQRIINSSTAIAAGNGSSRSSGSTADRRQMPWVPYKHSNGLAIYAHKGNVPGAAEFMVSAVVRGTPLEVLKVLLDPDSATTILGPALEVEVLDSSPAKQVHACTGRHRAKHFASVVRFA